jgi:hypothetical protein
MGAARHMNMFVNRRKSERRPCRTVAKIQLNGGTLPRDCTIVDMSATGIRVIAEYPEIPAEFAIAIANQRPRRCRLAWRIGFEFGAEFLE